MNNFGYLFAGLASVWIVTFVYLGRLHRHAAQLEHKLAAIESRLRSHD